MNIKRVFEIINNEEIKDIYYENEPVWIQELNNNVAKIGFINGFEEKSVLVENLHEKIL